MHIFAVLLLHCFCTCSASVKRGTTPPLPQVILKSGTVIGTYAYGVDSFRGIPFAQPPVGSLRLKPPQPLVSPFGTVTDNPTPTGCPQAAGTVAISSLPTGFVPSLGGLPKALLLPFLASLTPTSVGTFGEDCLTINVQRPYFVSASSKLPVLFWIYGGGFETGHTALYDGTRIVQTSIGLSEPIIYVAVNYRLGAFGFLAGKDLQEDGSTNLGLRDQRAGLEWVAENIEAFGGDPDRVTIWGESAGALSVTDQMLINSGNNTYHGRPLFRGAMMDSGSTLPAHTVTHPKAQAVFDQVAAAAGCGTVSNVLDCLRTAPYETFYNASLTVPLEQGYSSLNNSYLARPDPQNNFFPLSPELAVQQGRFTKIPIITGNQEDEGTLFALSEQNVTTTSALEIYFRSWFPGASQNVVSDYISTYPVNPSAGSPFGSGSDYDLYMGYKRLAAVLGDYDFIFQRRAMLTEFAAKVPAWSYISAYLFNTSALGTFHSSDVFELYQSDPFTNRSIGLQGYYINFVNNLNPNVGTTSYKIDATNYTLKHWPRYKTSTKNMLKFGENTSSVITDDFRESSYEVFSQYQSVFSL